jgi:hypothetical protein
MPILLAAAWKGLPATFAVTGAVSAAFLVHVALDWQGGAIRQADQLAEVATFWIVAPDAGLLFRALRRSLARVERAHADTLTALAPSLELRERYTVLLADKLAIKDRRLARELEIGALLHDIGKIGIPDHILLKPGPLDDDRALREPGPCEPNSASSRRSESPNQGSDSAGLGMSVAAIVILAYFRRILREMAGALASRRGRRGAKAPGRIAPRPGLRGSRGRKELARRHGGR